MFRTGAGSYHVTPLTERSQVGQNFAYGLNSFGKGVADGITASKQAKASRKRNSTILREITNFAKQMGEIDDAQAERQYEIAESGSNAEIEGMVMGFAHNYAMSNQRAAIAAKKQQMQQSANAEVRAQESHEARIEEAAKIQTEQEQTNNVLRASMEAPKAVTEVNVPVPGMDKVHQQTAPEAPTVTNRVMSRREAIMGAIKENPEARIGDIIKQLEAGQPSISDQLAIQKYNDDVVAREVPGVGLARDAQAAKDVIEFKTTVEDTNKGVEGLLRILEAPDRKFSPTKRAEAKTLASMLKGSLRLAIVGPGAMTEKEMKLLDDIVVNPTKLFKLDYTARAALNKLRSHLEGQLETRYRNNIPGYQPEPEPVATWNGYGLQGSPSTPSPSKAQPTRSNDGYIMK